jgi:hypothetical protein
MKFYKEKGVKEKTMWGKKEACVTDKVYFAWGSVL